MQRAMQKHSNVVLKIVLRQLDSFLIKFKTGEIMECSPKRCLAYTKHGVSIK